MRSIVKMDMAVAKVLSEQAYIMYREGDYKYLASKTGIDTQMQKIFNSKIQALNKKSLNTQLDALSYNAKAGDAVEVINALSNGSMLENILSQLARGITDSIDRNFSAQPYNAILAKASNYSSILEKGQASGQKLDSFLQLIVEAVAYMNKGTVPIDLLNALTDFGKRVGGQSFSFNKPNKINIYDGKEIESVKQVISLLDSAATQFEKNGCKLSKASFQQVITNIFSTSIGEELGLNMVATVLTNIDSELEKVLQELGVQINNTSFARNTSISNPTGKVDIINSNAFTFSVTLQNGQEITIELGSNISEKWYQDIAKNRSTSIHLVSKSTFGQILKDFDRDIGNIMRNIMAHRWDSEPLYEGMRSVIAASFIDEWLMGKGTKIQGGVDTAQFLLVNGKVYSVLEIIRKVFAQNMQYAVARTGLPSLSIGGQIALPQAKQWQPRESKDIDEWAPAFRRSDPLKELIDALTISCSFNSKMLEKYLHY